MTDFINMIVPVLLLTGGMVLGCMEYLHMLQLESYQLDGLARWVKANQNRAYAKGFIVAIVSLLSMTVLTFFAGGWTYLIACAVMFLGGLVSFILYKRVPAKKKLVFTKRVKRLLAIHTALYMVIFMVIDVFGDYVIQLRTLPLLAPAVWVGPLHCLQSLPSPWKTTSTAAFSRTHSAS